MRTRGSSRESEGAYGGALTGAPTPISMPRSPTGRGRPHPWCDQLLSTHGVRRASYGQSRLVFDGRRGNLSWRRSPKTALTTIIFERRENQTPSWHQGYTSTHLQSWGRDAARYCGPEPPQLSRPSNSQGIAHLRPLRSSARCLHLRIRSSKKAVPRISDKFSSFPTSM